MKTELWSIKENMAYTEANARLVRVGNSMIFATPKGELLVTRIK